MTTVAEISGAVQRLPKRELARFRKWFAAYDAAVWDRQLAADDAAPSRPKTPARFPKSPNE